MNTMMWRFNDETKLYEVIRKSTGEVLWSMATKQEANTMVAMMGNPYERHE